MSTPNFRPRKNLTRIPTYVLMIPKRHRQTDRRTDRRLTVASPRSALASRGKNLGFFPALQSAESDDTTIVIIHCTVFKSLSTNDSQVCALHCMVHDAAAAAELIPSHLLLPFTSVPANSGIIMQRHDVSFITYQYHSALTRFTRCHRDSCPRWPDRA